MASTFRKPTAKLSSDDVRQIIDNSKLPKDQRKTQKELSDQFGVSMKTISRVLTGQTWRDETQFNQRREHRSSTSVTYKPKQDEAQAMCDFLDELTAIKNHFGFSFVDPLYWGWFPWHDGKHAVCSDGFIMWESDDLVKFAQNVKTSERNSHPFYADRAKELPTFSITEMMTQPIGTKFVIDAESGGIVRLVSEDNKVVFLRQKYVQIAQKNKMDIREAVGSTEYVYFTKARNRQTADTQSVVIACVSTMKEDE